MPVHYLSCSLPVHNFWRDVVKHLIRIARVEQKSFYDLSGLRVGLDSTAHQKHLLQALHEELIDLAKRSGQTPAPFLPCEFLVYPTLTREQTEQRRRLLYVSLCRHPSFLHLSPQALLLCIDRCCSVLDELITHRKTSQDLLNYLNQQTPHKNQADSLDMLLLTVIEPVLREDHPVLRFMSHLQTDSSSTHPIEASANKLNQGGSSTEKRDSTNVQRAFRATPNAESACLQRFPIVLVGRSWADLSAWFQQTHLQNGHAICVVLIDSPNSFLPIRPYLLPHQGLEQQAFAACSQIKSWINQGLGRIAIIPNDRTLTKRVIAHLAREAIAVEDDQGWPLNQARISKNLLLWLDFLEKPNLDYLIELLDDPAIKPQIVNAKAQIACLFELNTQLFGKLSVTFESSSSQMTARLRARFEQNQLPLTLIELIEQWQAIQHIQDAIKAIKAVWLLIFNRSLDTNLDEPPTPIHPNYGALHEAIQCLIAQLMAYTQMPLRMVDTILLLRQTLLKACYTSDQNQTKAQESRIYLSSLVALSRTPNEAVIVLGCSSEQDQNKAHQDNGILTDYVRKKLFKSSQDLLPQNQLDFEQLKEYWVAGLASSFATQQSETSANKLNQGGSSAATDDSTHRTARLRAAPNDESACLQRFQSELALVWQVSETEHAQTISEIPTSLAAHWQFMLSCLPKIDTLQVPAQEAWKISSTIAITSPTSLETSVSSTRLDALLPNEIAATRLKTLTQCNYQFMLETLAKLRNNQRSSALQSFDLSVYGSLIHAYLQYFHEQMQALSLNNSVITAHIAQDWVEQHTDQFVVQYLQKRKQNLWLARDLALINMEQYYWQQRIKAIMVHYIDHWLADQQHGWQLHAQEQSVRINHHWLVNQHRIKPLSLYGRFDRLDSHSDNQNWRLIDYKTRTPSSLQKEKENDPQLPIYAWILSQTREKNIKMGWMTLRKEQVSWVPYLKKNNEDSFSLSDYAAHLLDEQLMALATQMAGLLQLETQNPPPAISISPETSYCQKFCQKSGICRQLG
jgi:RecB family exonuclease